MVLNKSQEIILLNASASALLEEPDSLIGEVSPFNGDSEDGLLIEIPDTDGRIRQMELQSTNFFHDGELYFLVSLYDVFRDSESLEVSVQKKTTKPQAGEASGDFPDEDDPNKSLQNQALRSMGHLAGGIAHDFNNLLTAVLGNLSIVRMALGASHSEGREITVRGEGSITGEKFDAPTAYFHEGRGARDGGGND